MEFIGNITFYSILEWHNDFLGSKVLQYTVVPSAHITLKKISKWIDFFAHSYQICN